jgi:hypothetical protein
MVDAGFFAGTEGELLGPAPSNRTGHYEPISVLKLNEDLLRSLGSRWWAEAPEEIEEPLRTTATQQIEKLLDEHLDRAEGAPIVIKEPRINGLLDLWGPIVEDLLHPVLVIRSPLEVAFSLVTRDGNSAMHALAAWEIQSTALLRWADGKFVTVAPYARLTASPEAVVGLVAEVAAQLEPSRTSRVNAELARDAIDPGLRHQDAGENDPGEYLTARQRDLWEFLNSIPPGSSRLVAPETLLRDPKAARSSVRSEGERIQLAGEREALRGQVADLSEELGKVRIERDQATTEKSAALHQAAAAAADLERAQVEGSEARQQVEEMLRSSSWRLTRPLRALRQRLSS